MLICYLPPLQRYPVTFDVKSLDIKIGDYHDRHEFWTGGSRGGHRAGAAIADVIGRMLTAWKG